MIWSLPFEKRSRIYYSLFHFSRANLNKYVDFLYINPILTGIHSYTLTVFCIFYIFLEWNFEISFVLRFINTRIPLRINKNRNIWKFLVIQDVTLSKNTYKLKKTVRVYSIWGHLSLSELTPIISNIGLTYLGFEASIYSSD